MRNAGILMMTLILWLISFTTGAVWRETPPAPVIAPAAPPAIVLSLTDADIETMRREGITFTCPGEPDIVVQYIGDDRQTY
jgi:hypothetical protein